MKIVTSSKELQSFTTKIKQTGKTIGFVPTMGFLHEGHLSLVHRSVKECDVTIMSIFVNPLQFGPGEDFDRYPRDIERDKALAQSAKVDLLFCPEVEDLYPSDLSVKMSASARTNVLCGASRPGHFDGVVSVLSILFHIVQPNKAFFGQKDAQQVAVVEGLVDSYYFPLEIVAVETIREKDGLAKSSRNVYLTEQERKEAPALYRALQTGEKSLVSKTVDETIETIVSMILEHTSGEIDYVQVLQYPSLEPLQDKKGQVIIALAVKFSNARLIDNVVFTLKEEAKCIVQ